MRFRKINQTNIFLIDGIGALVSAVFLGVVLPHFQLDIGLPLHILYSLCAIAVLLSFYSLSCHFRIQSEWRRKLTPIPIVNGLYAALTLILVGIYRAEMSAIGLLYFYAEVVVLAALIFLELKLLKIAKRQN